MKKEILCLETRLDLVEFCISSCLSRMVKMEVWMRKVQDKMDGVVPEVIDLTSEDREGEEAIGDVLGSPFLDLGPLTLGTRTQIPTRHTLDTLGVQTTSDSNVPSGYRLGVMIFAGFLPFSF